jgi:hypothetical protein
MLPRLRRLSGSWILFDTATRPEYYGDVHEVIALPAGALITYQYRKHRLTEAAIAAAEGRWRTMPRDVLVIYGQDVDFVRGGAEPGDPPSTEQMRWQGLRCARLVACWIDGEHYNFQFKVTGYPQEAEQARAFAARLHEQEQAPFHKWVAFSDQGLRGIGVKSDSGSGAWQRVVDVLNAAPMQFKDDMFWRVAPPQRSKFLRGQPIRSRYRRVHEGDYVRRQHHYVVPERCEFKMVVRTHEPSAAPARPSTAPVPEMAVTVSDDGPLVVTSAPKQPLRRNAGIEIGVESKHSAKSETKTGELRLASTDTLASKQQVTLVFQVRLAPWKRALGIIMFCIGAAAVVVAGLLTSAKNFDDHVLPIVALAIGGVILVGGGRRLSTGSWDFTS